MSAVRKKITVALNEEEQAFIKWLAKRDGLTEQLELQQIFYTELQQLTDLYLEEMRQDTQ